MFLQKVQQVWLRAPSAADRTVADTEDMIESVVLVLMKAQKVHLGELFSVALCKCGLPMSDVGPDAWCQLLRLTLSCMRKKVRGIERSRIRLSPTYQSAARTA